MTRYKLLRAELFEDNVDGWVEAGTVDAHSVDHAIRVGCAGQPGTFVAVPERSWKPLTVTVETTTRVKIR